MKINPDLKNILHILCNVIHNMQKERGILCLYLCEPNTQILNDAKTCIQNNDVQMDLLNDYIENVDGVLNLRQTSSIKKMVQVFNVFKSKTPFRSDLDRIEIDIDKVIPLYTYHLIVHLMNVLIEIALFSEDSNQKEVSALSNFINWKERIGRERALGVMGFSLGEFDSEVFTRDFKFLLDEQELNKGLFLALASDQQQSLFKKHFSAQHDVDAFHQQMKEKLKPQLDAQFWFDIVSHKMDMMHKIELLLFDLLLNKGEHEENEKLAIDTLFTDAEKQQVLKYPLFRKLSEKVKEDLFKSSNVKSYKKGSLLFLEGEQATRIFVVLSGWVKVFKSNLDGLENIEYMLTSGEVVIESSIFSSSNYNNSAQVSTEAKLLSFPAAIYRNLVSKDLTLALNSLKYLSQSSERYQKQIDSNRSKSSIERVGQFLLREFVNQKNPNTILLPYEKTIIASVLDMKPETFSRSLKALKKVGLSSEKQQIQIENIKTLCNYCDKEIASSCQFKDKHDCKFKQKAEQLSGNTKDTRKSF